MPALENEFWSNLVPPFFFEEANERKSVYGLVGKPMLKKEAQRTFVDNVGRGKSLFPLTVKAMERHLELQREKREHRGEDAFPVPARRMSIDTHAARRGSSSFKTPRKQSMPRVLPPVSAGGSFAANGGFATPRIGTGSGVSETPGSSKRSLCPSAPGRSRSAGRNRYGGSAGGMDDDEEEEHVEKDLLAELAEEHVEVHAATPSWTTYTPVQSFGGARRGGGGGGSAGGAPKASFSSFKRISPHGAAAVHDEDDDIDGSIYEDQENRHRQMLGFDEERRGLASAPASLVARGSATAARSSAAAELMAPPQLVPPHQPLDEVELPSIFNMAATMTTRTPKKLDPLGAMASPCTSEAASHTVPLSASQRTQRGARHRRAMDAAGTSSRSSSSSSSSSSSIEGASDGPPPQLVKSWQAMRRNRKRVFEDMSKRPLKPLVGGAATMPASDEDAESPPNLPRQQQMRKLSGSSPLPAVSFGELRRHSDISSLSSAMGGMTMTGPTNGMNMLPPPGIGAARR